RGGEGGGVWGGGSGGGGGAKARRSTFRLGPLTSGSKRYVVLRSLLCISNLPNQLIEMHRLLHEVDLVCIYNQQWRFVVPVEVVRIRLAELLQILRRDRFFVGSPALFNAPQ